MFAIQFCQFETNNRAGHLLVEISRITKFLLDRRAVFQVKLTSNHYRRSPIVKGGLEMFCVVTIKIAKSAFTVPLLERYDIPLYDLYIEPLAKEVFGCFINMHHNVQEDVPSKTKPTDDWKKHKVQVRYT